MLCAYCAKAKPAPEMTDEHVVPRKLGGNVQSKTNPFVLKNVCKICNSASGRHIDGPFIRSWLIQNQRAQNAKHFLDLSIDPIVPLAYMGELKQSWIPEKTCDFWLGPTGDGIYHFHQPYPQVKGAELSIGPPLYLRANEIDPGFAFLFIRATNPAWHKCIILSFVEHFEESTLYLGNGPTIPGGRFSDIPRELVAVHKQMKSLRGQQHQIQFTVGVDFGHRFLAKLALGFGSLFLHPNFLTSVDATLLRDFMWQRNPNTRANIQIGGTSFIGQKLKPIEQILGWSAGHVILMLPLDGKLLLVPIFYGEQSATIQITSNQSHWDGKIDKDGSLFVIAPGLKEYVGPISFSEYLAVKTNVSTSPISLVHLFSRVSSLQPLPPYDLIP